MTSYKYIEFHNCEFDYNSAKTGYETIDNAEGITQEYTINIYYDDCYENRYNEFISKEIGDMIYLDTMKYIVDSDGEVIGFRPEDMFEFNEDIGDIYIGTDLDDRINALRYTENESSLSSISQKLTKKLVDKIVISNSDELKCLFKNKPQKTNLKELVFKIFLWYKFFCVTSLTI